jgi:nickel transport protein
MRKALALLVLLFPPAAEAHRIKVFATAEARTISGRVYFPGGGRAKGVTVAFLAPDGARLGEAVTDKEGNFSFQTTVRCDHEVVVETADGHRDSTTVTADELDANLPARSGAESVAPAEEGAPPAQAPPSDLEALVDRAVARHVRPLREQLDAYEERRRLHDILGGIGIIFGVCGIVFYFLAKRGERMRS